MAKASSVTEGIISDNEEEFFLDDSDIIDEIVLDDEDLPDVEDDDDEENVSEDMLYAEPDDAVDLFAHHSGPLYAVACSPKNATLVASGGGDNLAYLWNIGCEDRVNELKGHRDSVSCLSFSKDGQLLASGGLDACVKIWDIIGNLKCTFQGPVEDHEFEWVRWHPSAHLVLAGCTDTTVWLWNADKGALLSVFCGHGNHVTCGGFTPDGYTKASALTCLTYTPDSNLALTGAENGVLSVANIANEKVTSSFSSHSSSIQCIGLSLSMRWVATGGADEKLVIWDLQHSACRNIFEYQDEITCLNWLGESMLVASGCGDGQIIVCDTRSGEHVRSFKGHSDKIQELAVSADNNFLVSVSEDGTARVFDISDFRC
ncbi:uncharacterized WD repeat-containing protein C25H1.08c-like [Chenopodium quinoa]|uniref:uncharacterized WD repeat-containing protein C25H1.08c-like n=1 Tax=Chenopodium quinoa TaxID=63459 RepID=UPI000B76FCC6|nr:uncharacterized WD repeat-containing protein C25H1.08c-like [Chenopodium quinoa]